MRHTLSPGSGFFAVAALVAVLLVWPTAANAQLGGPPYVDPDRVLALEYAVKDLKNAVNKLLTLLTCVSRKEGEINGVSGPHLLITGCNVHIRSGSGATHDTTTNLGNLIIGYNEPRGVLNGDPPDTTNRTGSHTLIIGPEHQFTASGGLLAGFRNTVTGESASVSGGQLNTASGIQASVSGGGENTASGPRASVSGGAENMASGGVASVSGGSANEASGGQASVSGGSSNKASSTSASVSGGLFNEASGGSASVSGGQNNKASGAHASVSGGEKNEASGSFASVSGGNSRTADEIDEWCAGTQACQKP